MDEVKQAVIPSSRVNGRKFSLSGVSLCLQLGFVPTLRAVLRSPTLLLYPSAISRIFMNHVWSAYGDGVDTNSRAVKEGLVTANAQGVVLDIGAGA